VPISSELSPHDLSEKGAASKAQVGNPLGPFQFTELADVDLSEERFELLDSKGGDIEVDPDVPCGCDGPLAQLRQPRNDADSSHGNPLAEKGLVYYTSCVESTEIVLRPRGGREKPEKPA
jgi:hypothetical protein